MINLASKKIILKREIEGERYECLAEIRVKEYRPYITTILKLAQKNGLLSEELIHKNLLPEESLAMSTNILRRYEQIGFVDSNGKLTEYGRKAVNGDIYMPLTGNYYIDVTSNPLIADIFLLVETPNERKNHTNDNKKEELMKVPNILSQCKGKLSLVWFNNEVKHVGIMDIEENVRLIERKVKYESIVTVGIDEVEMKLKKEKSEITRTLENMINVKNVWNSFVNSHDLKWKGEPLDQGYCLVKYDDTKLEERINFTKKIEESVVKIDEELGSFTIDSVDINVQPASIEDASKWLLDLIQNKINEYVTEIKYDMILEEVMRKFKSYTPNKIDMTGFIDHLYEKAKKSKEKLPAEYWYVQVPMDLTINKV
jgi:hypothetical protein